MEQNFVSVTTSSTNIIAYQGGDFGELVLVFNPSVNSNTVFLSLNRDATTASVTGQIPIAPGGMAFFILNSKQNASGINGIAATGATVVTYQRFPFLSPEEYLSVLGGVAGGAAVAQYWTPVSGTQIQTSGAIVEARADTIRPKTSGNTMRVAGDQGTNGLAIATGANGNIDITANGTGQAAVASATGTFIVCKGSGSLEINMTVNSVQKAQIDATLGFALMNATQFQLTNGAGTDPRHTLTVSQQVLHTAVAGGAIQSSLVCYEFPVKNGSTVTSGDIVEFDNNNNNRIASSAIGSVQIILGLAQTTATGNAGGTVFARVAIEGWVTGTIADTGGVTVLQYIKPGTTTANKVNSTAALAVNSFGRCTLTATATNPTSYMLCRA